MYRMAARDTVDDRAEEGVLKALACGTRLRILRMLHSAGGRCVRSVADELGISEAAVSQHLGVLRRAGLVVGGRQGNRVHYRVRPDGLEPVRRLLLGLDPKRGARRPCSYLLDDEKGVRRCADRPRARNVRRASHRKRPGVARRSRSGSATART